MQSDPLRPQWRILRGWSSAELERRMLVLRNHAAPADRSSADGGLYQSEAVIACERPGLPEIDGPFERARELVRRYDFSDPRIVTGHFDRSADLLGRLMLLEIKVLGVHALCAAVVTDVKDLRARDSTVWGFRYDTLASHVQSGSEWFVLIKDHQTGEVHFRIEALWQESNRSSAMGRLGFHLLARRYLRAWHRLAYLRLRLRLEARGLPALPRGERLVHVGAPLPAPSIEAMARPQPPAGFQMVEVSVERLAAVPGMFALDGT
jgi:uncharacterized protein (UPF0548 family)